MNALWKAGLGRSFTAVLIPQQLRTCPKWILEPRLLGGALLRPGSDEHIKLRDVVEFVASRKGKS